MKAAATPRLALRPPEAAQSLGVGLSTLMDWVAAGEIPHVRLGDRCLRFPVADLERWLSQKTNQSLPPTETDGERTDAAGAGPRRTTNDAAQDGPQETPGCTTTYIPCGP